MTPSLITEQRNSKLTKEMMLAKPVLIFKHSLFGSGQFSEVTFVLWEMGFPDSAFFYYSHSGLGQLDMVFFGGNKDNSLAYPLVAYP